MNRKVKKALAWTILLTIVLTMIAGAWVSAGILVALKALGISFVALAACFGVVAALCWAIGVVCSD